MTDIRKNVANFLIHTLGMKKKIVNNGTSPLFVLHGKLHDNYL